MSQQQVNIKMTMDTSELANTARTAKDAFLGLADAIEKAKEAGDWSKVAELSRGLKDIRTAAGGIQTEEQARQVISSGAGGAAADAPKKSGNILASGLRSGTSAISSIAGGSYADAAIGIGRDVSSSLKNYGEKKGGDFGNILGKAGGVIEIATMIAGAGDKLSQQWESQMEPAMDMNAMLNGPAGSLEENTKNIRESFARAADAANEFGYSMEEGIKVVGDLTRFGLTGEEAFVTEKNVMQWARATGVDANILASVTGTFSRYGEGNNILEMSSGAAAASGMQMGQFGEFVESLKSVFESAISNGMIKGADKIAQSMVLLEKLSGGSELWKGEQGASRFLQMSDTISQATKLMSPTDILSYRAASGIAGTYLSGTGEWEKQFGSKRGGDYVDNMLILESGLSPALMLAQKKMVESVAGEGNRAGQVEQYRQMYGLNYTGAAQVYEMMGKLGTEGYGEEDITNKIEAMQKDPQYLSNELNMLKTVEDIRTEVTKTGQTMSDIKTDMMSPVKSVVGWVANKAQDNLYGDMARGATQGLFSAGVKEDDKAREAKLQIESKYPLVKLADIAKISRGASPRPIDSYLTDNKDGVNWIKIGDVNPTEKYITHANEKVTIEGALKSKRVNVGDFIISNSMSIGRPYILKIEGCIHDGWLLLSTIADCVQQDFLYYLLSSRTVQEQFGNHALGGVVKNLNIERVSSVQIPLPSLEIQQKIVADIEVLEREEKKNNSGIQSSRQKIESYFEIQFDDSTRRHLGQLVMCNPSKTELSNVADDTAISFVEMASVSNDGFITNVVERPLSDVRKGSYTYFKEEDIILAKITPCMENGKGALAIGLTNGIGMGSSEFHVLRCGSEIRPAFLFGYLNRQSIREEAAKRMTGASGHRRVPISFYEQLEISLPSLAKQQEIVTEIEKIEAEIRTVQAKLIELKMEKDGILQKYL